MSLKILLVYRTDMGSSDVSCRHRLIRKPRTEKQKERNAASQKKYYSKKKETDP